jgi:hypothetical protein
VRRRSSGSRGRRPLNPVFRDILTEAAADLCYRDDFELVTQNVLNAARGGIGYVNGSYHTFGNNGTIAVHGNVDALKNTALDNDLVQDGGVFIASTQLYADLRDASGQDSGVNGLWQTIGLFETLICSTFILWMYRTG